MSAPVTEAASLDIAGVAITEPMTMATDYLLAAWSVVLAVWLLRRGAGAPRQPLILWLLAFAVTAVAALAGGTAHGFALMLGAAGRAVVWKVTVVAIGLSALLMIAAGIRSVLRPGTLNAARRRAGKTWLWRAIVITLGGLAIQQSGCGLHRHMNHNDLYHLVQMAGLYCLYRGAASLHEAGG